MSSAKKRRLSASEVLAEERSGGWTVSDVLRSPYAVRVPGSAKEAATQILAELRSQIKEKGRDSFVIGINATTRALERGQISLLLLSRGIVPLNLVTHIIPLCCERRVPIIILAGDGLEVAKVFNVKSAAVIGSKILNPDLVAFASEPNCPAFLPVSQPALGDETK